MTTPSAVNSPHVRPWRAIGWVALAAGILFIRKTDAFLHPQFWAEDFWPFFVQANTLGRTSFWWEYNGYHHFLPRLIAAAAAPLDPAWQPAAYLVASLFVTLIVVAQAFSPRLDLPARPLLALAIVCVPHTGEVFLNPTNLQWITALGLLFTLLKRDPATVVDWGVDLIVIIAAGLTGPFSVLWAPLFIARALLRRTITSGIVAGAILIPALIQGWILWHAVPLPDLGPWHPASVPGMLALRLVMTMAIGATWAVKLGPGGTLALSAVLGAVLFIFINRRDPQRIARLMLLTALGLTVVAATKRIRPDTWASYDVTNGDRYFYVPKVIALWLCVLAIATMHRRWQRIGGYALLAVSFLTNLSAFRIAPYPDLKWASYCGKIRAGEEVEIPINPGWKRTYPRSAPRR